MLEKIVQTLQTFEKYTVRVTDESVHHLVNKAVVWIEKNKDVSREDQAFSLNVATAFLGSAILPPTHYAIKSFSLHQDSWTESFVPYIEMIKTWCNYFPFLIGVKMDLAFYSPHNKHRQSDGTIAKDVHSYSSFTGVIRPYALGASITGIVYGIINLDAETLEYSTVALPWTLSFYVRDDNSGGLLQKIKSKVKELVSFRLPVYQHQPIKG